MNIQFDSNITPSEAQGIILLLTALFPALNNSQPVNPSAPQLSDPAPAEQTPLTQAGPTPVQPDTDQPTRRRRTRAEIAADEAQAKVQQAALAAGVPVAEPTPQTTIESTTEAPKPISGDELRNGLNAFIAKHSMEEALALLQEFKCNRIAEALALDPAKLAELASKLRG